MKIHKDLIQQTPEWFELKKWKISGTSLKWAIGWPKAQLTQMYELLAELYIEEEDLRPFEILERGNMLEWVAKLFFEEITWKKIEEVWFIEKDDQHGLSPDWIIATNEVAVDITDEWPITEIIYWEALEIKCPRWKNYVKYYIENKIPEEYKQQVINYFIVMEDLEKLYFMIYSNDTINGLPPYKIIEVTREELEQDLKKAEERILSFKEQFNILKWQLNIKN